MILTHFEQLLSKCFSIFCVVLVLSRVGVSFLQAIDEEYNHCLATTPSGVAFRGALRQSLIRPDVNFCSFLGLRYAKSSLGDRRFGKPILVVPSVPGVYNATSNSEKCPQILNESVEGDEDCLFLNVFTPKTPWPDHQSLKPVIVFIPGGGLTEGSCTSREFSPDYLMEHDVIFVVMNYRVNLFGFLNLGIPECGGNMGLRDQITALQWVQQNIRWFGGDPNSVTLAGESAGAISAYLVALSPLSRGMFGKLILQSAIGNSFVENSTESNSIRFAEYMGYKGNTTYSSDRRRILRYLQRLSKNELLTGFEKFSKNRKNILWPSPDDFLEDAVLPKSLEELGEAVPGIPIIAGQTDMDGTVFFYRNDVNTVISDLLNNMEMYLDPVFTRNKTIENVVTNRIKEYYFNQQNSESELTKAIKLYTDLHYFNFYPQLAIFKESYYSQKIYNYQFAYDGTLQFFKRLYLGEPYYRCVRGASHAEELNYQYYLVRFMSTTSQMMTANDLKIIRDLSSWWTNFAKTGNPNGSSNITEVEWKPISSARKNYLRIALFPQLVETRINEERLKFWDSLPRAST